MLAQWQLVIELAGRLREDEVEAIDPELRHSIMTAFRHARPA